MALFLQYVIRYRKKVVLDNLRHAFPEKSEKEIRKIATGFYRHFCDWMFETLKLLSISSKNIVKRTKLLNPEVVPEMVAHGAGGVAVFSHYANWEWLAAGLGPQLTFKTYGIYKPLKSRVFERLVLHLRTRMGNEMIAQKDTYRQSLVKLKDPCYIGFLMDQTPARQGKLFFTSFMGRPAAVHLGAAQIAIKVKCPMYYFDIQKVKRGKYTLELRKIPTEDCWDGSKESLYRLTDRHVQMLEGIIREKPEYWLWSHRRWKRKIKEGDIVR